MTYYEAVHKALSCLEKHQVPDADIDALLLLQSVCGITRARYYACAGDTIPEGETLTTINKFFENSLNVSETSRQLYIHRNTLVYRLDKLQKQTGLDLRVFEDAITLKIALMVVKYMNYMESQDY